MGLDSAAVTFLCGARALGVDFSRTAVIGRQAFFPRQASLRRVFAALGVEADPEAYIRENRYGEGFFSLLGARELTSIDYSGYENASVEHDMNRPVPADLRERFTTVHDGGTLEHVFNVPQALKNCMEMVEVGGHFTQVSVANNYMGHGFWQFSPELVFRVFSPANGFQVRAVLLRESRRRGGWYTVRDPRELRARVELRNSRPTCILTIARRIARAEIFTQPPQQSDYVARWNGSGRPPGAPADAAVPATGNGGLLRLPLPRAARAALLRFRPGGIHRPFDGPPYRRIEVDALLRGEFGPEV